MKTVLKYAVYVGLFAVLLVPLYVDNLMYFPFISGKGFLFRSLVEIVFGLWLILAISDSEYRPKRSVILGSATAFLGIMGLATIFAENPYKSFWSNYERMEGYITLLHLVAYLVVLGTVFVKDVIWNRFWHLSIAVSLYLGYFGLVQVSGILEINQGGVRVDGTFGNAAYLAAYMLFSIFITLFYFISDRHKESRAILASWGISILMYLYFIFGLFSMSVDEAAARGIEISRSQALWMWLLPVIVGGFVLYAWRSEKAFKRFRGLLYVIPVILQAVILYFTATRGAAIGLVVGFIVMGILFARMEGAERIRSAARNVLLILVILFGLFFFYKDSSVVKNSLMLSRFASLMTSETLQYQAGPRLMIWNMAWQGFKERPFLGWGQENFNFVFNKYYDPRMYAQEQWFDRTHNIFLDWLVAGGVLGLLGYLALYLSTLFYIWRGSGSGWLKEFLSRMWYRFTSDEPTEAFSYKERVLLTGLLSGYFAQNFFVFDNIGTYILFFGLLAFVHSHIRGERRIFESVEVSMGLRNVLAVALIIATVFTVYTVNIKQIEANKWLIRSIAPYSNVSIENNLIAFEKTIEAKAYSKEEVAEQAATIATRAVANPQIPQGERDAIEKLAKDQLDGLIAMAPNNARFHAFKASLQNSLGEYSEAENSLHRALELSPKKLEFMRMLGINYINQEKITEALETFKKAYELESREHTIRTIYGLTLLAEGKKTEADEVLLSDLKSQGLEQFIPNDQVVGVYYDRYRAFDEIIQIREAAVLQKPDDPQQHVSLAVSYMGVERREDAIRELQKAIELEPAFKVQGEQLISIIRAGGYPFEQ